MSEKILADARPNVMGCTLEGVAVGAVNCFLIQTQNQIDSVQESQGVVR